MPDLEHIGIAVRSIEDSVKIYEELLQSRVYKIEDVPGEGVRTAFLKMGNCKLELLEASGRQSAVKKFIEKRGEGIHHLAFRVKDIRAEMRRLKRAGFSLINEEPKKGADNKWTCFIHPKSTAGVLIELCQEITEDTA